MKEEKLRSRIAPFVIIPLLILLSCGGAGSEGGNGGSSLRIAVQFPSELCLTTLTQEESSTRQSELGVETLVVTVTGNDFSAIEEIFDIESQIRVFVPVGNDRNFMIEGLNESGELVCRGGITADILPGLNTLMIQCIIPTPSPTPTPTATPSPTPTPTASPTPPPTPTPTSPPAEVCNDGTDNDGDEAIDCADPDCEGQIGPQEQLCEIPENATCNDGADNDGDNLIDCADRDCVGQDGPCGEVCEMPEESCRDGFDNDGDGQTDCSDPDCPACPEGTSCDVETGMCQAIPPSEDCTDGIDNDGDDLTDCADSDCEALVCINMDGDTSVCRMGTCPPQCGNGIDDDGDGFIDCEDSDCAGNPACNIP